MCVDTARDELIKTFVIGECTTGCDSPVEFYDDMMECSTEDEFSLLKDKHELELWIPFEQTDLPSLQDIFDNLYTGVEWVCKEYQNIQEMHDRKQSEENNQQRMG